MRVLTLFIYGLTVLFGSVSLIGCQTNGINSSSIIDQTINSDDWSAATPKPRLFQTITKYEWQLTHVTDENGQIQSFKHKPPLNMQARPDVLLFQEGCHRYQGTFNAMRPLPYPYSLPNMSDLADDCADVSDLDSSSNSDSNKGDIQRALEIVFAPYSDSYFRFDPVLSGSPLFSKNESKQLALKTDKGKTFIFAGTAKPEQKSLGLPITNELLERYQWHLIRATDNTNKPISLLNHPDVPITASFDMDAYNHSDYQQGAFSQSVGFFTGCNGAGGSYALSTNHTLLIGAAPSTLMGCGDLINGIENHLDRMMHNSTSQLHLSRQSLNQTDNQNEQTDFPHYNLLQKLDSGETLTWQNASKESR